MDEMTDRDPTVFIAYADPGPGILVEAENLEAARRQVWATPLFRASACGVVPYTFAPAKEKTAAGLRGWLSTQTEVVRTPLADKTDPPYVAPPPKADEPAK